MGGFFIQSSNPIERRLHPHIEICGYLSEWNWHKNFWCGDRRGKILEEFDVVKEVGRFTAIDKYCELTIEGSKLIVDDEEVDASWSDGNLLNINFINLGKDNPKLSALILIRKTLDDYMYYIDDGAVTCRNISIDVSWEG